MFRSHLGVSASLGDKHQGIQLANAPLKRQDRKEEEERRIVLPQQAATLTHEIPTKKEFSHEPATQTSRGNAYPYPHEPAHPIQPRLLYPPTTIYIIQPTHAEQSIHNQVTNKTSIPTDIPTLPYLGTPINSRTSRSHDQFPSTHHLTNKPPQTSTPPTRHHPLNIPSNPLTHPT